MLDEILDIGRLEAGTVKLALVPIDLDEAIEAAMATMSGMTRDEGVRLRKNGAIDGLVVQADADRLRQVLINLLSNAVKHNLQDEREIDVEVSGRNGAVFVDVIDNGGGVSREDAHKVFEKFARGSRAAAQGAGLGLPISRAIMRAMGGDLSVEFTEADTSFFRVHLLQGSA